MAEQTEQQGNEAGAAGGNAAPDKQGGGAFGTATRAPVFPSQAAAGTQGNGTAQGQDGAAAGGVAPTVRKPVGTAQIPDEALKVRLDRERRKTEDEYFQLLGVKTKAEAKAKLDSLKNAEQEGEKRRLAELSEVERYKAELATAQQRIAQLESQLAERDQEREHEQHEQVIVRVAGESIKPNALRLYKLDLAQHVKKLGQTNPELAEKFGERGIRRFTDKWLKENPEFAKASVDATQASAGNAQKPPVTGARPAGTQSAPVRRPVTTGAPVRKIAPPPVNGQPSGANGVLNGKTIKPGRPNSMTPQEVREYARLQGVNYSG
jgi:hypothetical protein